MHQVTHQGRHGGASWNLCGTKQSYHLVDNDLIAVDIWPCQHQGQHVSLPLDLTLPLPRFTLLNNASDPVTDAFAVFLRIVTLLTRGDHHVRVREKPVNRVRHVLDVSIEYLIESNEGRLLVWHIFLLPDTILKVPDHDEFVADILAKADVDDVLGKDV